MWGMKAELQTIQHSDVEDARIAVPHPTRQLQGGDSGEEPNIDPKVSIAACRLLAFS